MPNEEPLNDSGAVVIDSSTIPAAPIVPSLNHDVTRSHILSRDSVSNYDDLVEQLLEDENRPKKTKVHLDVNLSVDLDLTPEVYGDLHLSMLCATVKRKPGDPPSVGPDGKPERRIAGTVLRISDGQDRLLHRQVVGFESFEEWWWVVRVQLKQIIKQKAAKAWNEFKVYERRVGILQMTMLASFPLAFFVIAGWYWFMR